MGKWRFFIERTGYAWTLKWIGDDTIYEVKVCCMLDHYLIFYFHIFMSDKIDMVISAALLPVALLSAPMFVAK